MNEEKEIAMLMRNLDGDLIERELDALMDGAEIDVDSILEKAEAKLEREQKKMKKMRIIPIVAAVVCLMSTVAYATDLSDFLKSFFGKSTIYSTVVEGAGYYLDAPLDLGGNGRLYAVMAAEGRLEITIDREYDTLSVVTEDGREHEPQGYTRNPNGTELAFYDFAPVQGFTLVVDGESYPVKLSGGASALDGGDIVPARPNGMDWVNMGSKRIDGGVQIFTSFPDSKIRLWSIGDPTDRTVTERYSIEGDSHVSHSNHAGPKPLVGRGAGQGSYEFTYDTSETGLPLTKFYSDAPGGEALTLLVPAIEVGYETSLALRVDLPAVGQKSAPGKELDMGLQKMVLESVARTSETTVELTFRLNTGTRGNVSIRQASLVAAEESSGELVWEGDCCTMQVTFPQARESFELLAASPMFVIDGNWELPVE